MISIQERELIVKLHRQGKKQEYIANLIGCSQPTVHNWIRRAERGRSLKTLPRSGRPTKLTDKNLSLLKQRILGRVKSANEAFCSVSTKQLGELIRQEIGETYSMRHVERVMHKLGFSLIKPRSQHLRHDQEKVDAFRDEFKKNSYKNMWTMNSSPSMR
ncbi:MAG: winged helix-turn-helix domain-containing protein [archaeon]